MRSPELEAPFASTVRTLPSRRARGHVATGLVAFEGLDGTGKTFMARYLSEHYHATYRSTPGSELDLVRRTFHDSGGRASFFIYMSGCAYAVEASPPSRATPLFLDRYYFSSIVHDAWNARAGRREIDRLLKLGGELLPVPMLTVLLRSSESIRQERLAKRPATGFGPACAAYAAHWERCSERLRLNLPSGARVLEEDSSDRDHERIARAFAVEYALCLNDADR
jgi:hypothetical protein